VVFRLLYLPYIMMQSFSVNRGFIVVGRHDSDWFYLLLNVAAVVYTDRPILHLPSASCFDYSAYTLCI